MKCLFCNNKFKATHGLQKFCSIKCRDLNHKELRKSNKCTDCGHSIHKISIRCYSCEVKRKHKEGIIETPNKGHFGYHHTKETKLKIRKALRGNKCYMFGQPAHHGKWIKYKGIKMRSSYEVAYAKYLDNSKVKWQYEPKAFDLGNCTYRPDFYLPKKNLYIEIKGFWRDDAKKKFKLFKKCYSNQMIKVLNKEELIKLGVL